ncbi:MAG: peptide chain release factor N(5)-glutamine methyltransferase [Verrucomicrobiota bacterium]
MTVLEVISKSSDFLAKKGVDTPRLQTELLLAYVLQLPRMKLYLNFERKLTEPELDSLRKLVQRRGQREPLQHLIGSTSFCGFEMIVSRHVLIPRPETELLAEAGWQFLSTLNSQPSTALDFGTGSGCIAIALAAKCPSVHVVAIDLSAEGLAIAQQNAAKNDVAERIELRHGDGFLALKPNERFDLIVSNPPYIPSAEIETLQPEVRDHDPRGALDGGTDGLNFYHRLAAVAASFLKPSGKLMLEFGEGQAEAISAILVAQNWQIESVQPDYTKRLRFLIARPGSAGIQPARS